MKQNKATKRKVVVEIVATDTHCGEGCCGDGDSCPFIDLDSDQWWKVDKEGRPLRWPACIRAEKRAKVRR